MNRSVNRITCVGRLDIYIATSPIKSLKVGRLMVVCTHLSRTIREIHHCNNLLNHVNQLGF